jgi:hypothetical protein
MRALFAIAVLVAGADRPARAAPAAAGKAAPARSAGCPAEPGGGETAGAARLWWSPEAPIAGKPLRLVAVVDEAAAREGGRAELARGVLRAAGRDGAPRALETTRRTGPPPSFQAEVAAAPAGRLRVELSAGDATLACAVIEVRPRAETPPRQTAPASYWPTARAWDRATEGLFAAWVEALFDAPPSEALAFPSLAPVIRDPRRNFLHEHLGLGEDNPRTRDAPAAEPDCADLPYFLRAYFAWKLGLPMGLRDCTRGTSSAPPRCAALVTNEDPLPRAAKTALAAFKQFTRKLANTAHSGSARTALADDASDLYPTALARSALRPGTVYADPYGHVLVVVKWVPQTARSGGLLLAVDGQPDNSITRKRFWEGTFLFASGQRSSGPGFKVFRPLARAAPGAPLAPLDNAALEKDDRFAPFSREQEALEPEAFYARLSKLVNPRGLDARAAYEETLAALVEQLEARVTSVANGETYMAGPGKGTVVSMPEGPRIFETVGPWEDYATPSRDMRLLIAMKVLLGLPERIVKHPDLFVLGGRKPAEVRREVEALHERLAAERAITYKRSDGAPQRLTVAELLARRAGLEAAYNPNDCIELRWAAPAGSPELAACTRRAPDDQRARMEQIRAWFRETRRPPR